MKMHVEANDTILLPFRLRCLPNIGQLSSHARGPLNQLERTKVVKKAIFITVTFECRSHTRLSQLTALIPQRYYMTRFWGNNDQMHIILAKMWVWKSYNVFYLT